MTGIVQFQLCQLFEIVSYSGNYNFWQTKEFKENVEVFFPDIHQANQIVSYMLINLPTRKRTTSIGLFQQQNQTGGVKEIPFFKKSIEFLGMLLFKFILENCRKKQSSDPGNATIPSQIEQQTEYRLQLSCSFSVAFSMQLQVQLLFPSV